MPKPKTRAWGFVREGGIQKVGLSPKDLEPKRRGRKKGPRPLPSLEDIREAWANAAHYRQDGEEAP